MNLKEQLKAKRMELESGRDKTQTEVMRHATEQLIREGIGNSALEVSDEIPSFGLPNVRGQLVEIKDLLKNGPIILTFYRGSWCPYCNLELRAYQQNIEEIKALGAQVIAISPELPDSSLSNAEKLALEFEVLSDFGNVVARNFGLVFKMSEEWIDVFQQLDSDFTAHNGDDTWELPVPATYVVSSDSKIVFSYVNANYLERADPQQVVAALTELSEKT